jgi:hypothetical protein
LTLSDITSADLTGGTYKVEATATYAPNTGKEPTGDEIVFSASYTTASNPTPVSKSITYKLSKTGIAVFSDTVIQGNEAIILRLTATHGDLFQKKLISIPAVTTVVSVLSASPSTITFASTDVVFTDKAVTMTGINTPFTAASALPADISVLVSGSTVTITKLASGTTTAATTTVTITDAKGNTVSVPVRYYK